MTRMNAYEKLQTARSQTRPTARSYIEKLFQERTVFLQIYMCNVDTIREDVPQMVELLLECIKALQDVIGELKRFKSSKTIGQSIIRVNDLEEQGDRLYVENMHRLYGESDLRTVVVWKNIYACIENCMDVCEHAADIVNTVIMKNS